MSPSTLETHEQPTAADLLPYRAVHAGAIVGLVLGAISAVTVFAGASSLDTSLMVAPIPVLGAIVSLRSLARIGREPEQYTGRPLALAGLVLSLAFLVAGVGYGGYVHITEVPPDHTRISFGDMRPDVVQERSGVIVRPEIMALDGQRVFIKGYMRPPKTRTGIDRFLLVRDNQQCCFGDLSAVKYYDQILVDLTGSLRLTYSEGLFAIGGVLKVTPENVAYGPMAPVFTLQADYAR
jgi:hypothetical protein